MQSTDILLTIAEIAVALAGFSAIVVMLNSKPIREWDDTARLNLRILVQVSAFTIAFALLPSILNIPFDEPELWTYALWTFGVVHIVDVSNVLFRMKKKTPNIFRVTVACGTVIALSQLVVAGIGNAMFKELFYLGTLLWYLGVTFLVFILLLYGVKKTC